MREPRKYPLPGPIPWEIAAKRKAKLDRRAERHSGVEHRGMKWWESMVAEARLKALLEMEVP